MSENKEHKHNILKIKKLYCGYIKIILECYFGVKDNLMQ